jgi:hypothetical protein
MRSYVRRAFDRVEDVHGLGRKTQHSVKCCHPAFVVVGTEHWHLSLTRMLLG